MHSAWRLDRFVLAAIALGMAACGGGGAGPGPGDDDWLYPLTVPTDVVIVDLDGDGLQDVLALEMYTTSQPDRHGRLLFYRQATSGTFAAPQVTTFGIYPWRLAVSDLDGDGAPDVVASDVDADQVWLLWQEAANRGHFEPAIALTGNASGADVVIGDFDADGVPDVAVPGNTAARDTVRVFLQDATQRGNFLPAVSVAVPAPTAHATAGDLDRDGRTDLVAQALVGGGGAQPPENEIGVRVQLEDGSFGAWQPLMRQTGLNIVRLAVGDYDGDGAGDLLAYLTPFSDRYTATLAVVRQDAAPGTFLAASNSRLDGVHGINDAVFADLNRDGRPDAAVAGFFPTGSPSTVKSRINLFVQSGGGFFAPATVHESPVAVSCITAGDLDGDGATDLVACAGEQGCVSMLQSSGAPGTFSAPRLLR